MNAPLRWFRTTRLSPTLMRWRDQIFDPPVDKLFHLPTTSSSYTDVITLDGRCSRNLGREVGRLVARKDEPLTWEDGSASEMVRLNEQVNGFSGIFFRSRGSRQIPQGLSGGDDVAPDGL